MDKPSPRDLVKASGISLSYATMILSDDIGDKNKSRVPPRSLAILIYRKTGWPHPTIADLTEEQMKVLEQVDPWSPKTAQDEAA
jgi:hypothetical protein